MTKPAITSVCVLGLIACGSVRGTEAPPSGWANAAPTVVQQTVDRGASQLLEIRQGELTTWVQIPAVGAQVGDYILLGQGTAQQNVEVPELSRRIPELVTIEHARVVDLDEAKRVVFAAAPEDALTIETIYSRLDELQDQTIVVFGTVSKASGAIGWNWVHLRDGTGDPSNGTHDLTVKTQVAVIEGQRVAFRGTLRKDVDLGFGYHYDALVEEGQFINTRQP